MTASLFVSCGEASGDLYAGELVRALRTLAPDVRCFGMGGSGMSSAGAEVVVPLERVSVLGVVEVLGKLRQLRKAFRALVNVVIERRPRACVLIDFSGFHLRLARKLKTLGVPIVYYVSPQVWAWRAGRVRTIRDTISKMLVILPFEKHLYEDAGVPVEFVGHPLVDLVRSEKSRQTFCAESGLDPERPVVALLPGSRRREIELHLPLVRDAVERLAAERRDLQFALLKAGTADRAAIESALQGMTARVVILEGATYEGLAHAAVAVVASGTATVEAALSGTPMVVVYRLGALSYEIGKRLVRVPHVAMVNLIAGRSLVPELIQGRMTGGAIAGEVLKLLEDRASTDAMRDGLAAVKTALGRGGASRRAAEEVLAISGLTVHAN